MGTCNNENKNGGGQEGKEDETPQPLPAAKEVVEKQQTALAAEPDEDEMPPAVPAAKEKQQTALAANEDEMQPLPAAKEEVEREVENTMVVITNDKKEADETRKQIEQQEKDAREQGARVKQIAEDAQRDFDKALPALERALESLKNLSRNDIVEVKSLQNPPAGVRTVMEATCIMFDEKPKMKDDLANVGKKIPDYWEPSKKLLSDPTKFLDSLFSYDKDNIPDHVIKKIKPYIQREDFTPEAISKVSKACTSICMWARAMYVYHNVARHVRLPQQEQLDATMEALRGAQAKLQFIENKTAALETDNDEAAAKEVEKQQTTLAAIEDEAPPPVPAANKEEVEEQQAALAAAQEEELDMMVVIPNDKEADETKKQVEQQEKNANDQATPTKPLGQGVEVLNAMLRALNSLCRSDIVELRSMRNPPAGVRTVMAAVCILFDEKPKMKDDPANIGKKIPDYWEPSKKLLNDPSKFINSLIRFDKDNIPDHVIKKIEPYMQRENFTPEAMNKVSRSCSAMCTWVHAMYVYHNVAQSAASKRPPAQGAVAQG